MPIVMVSTSHPGLAWESRCYMSYPQAKDAIPPECSYKFVPDKLVQIQPKWYPTYAPQLGDLITQK